MKISFQKFNRKLNRILKLNDVRKNNSIIHLAIKLIEYIITFNIIFCVCVCIFSILLFKLIFLFGCQQELKLN